METQPETCQPPTKRMKLEEHEHTPQSTSTETRCSPQLDIAGQLLALERAQSDQLLALPLSPPFIYNPISYADETHELFVRTYGNSKKHILFLGMNPGPFGMAQNGVREYTYSGERWELGGWEVYTSTCTVSSCILMIVFATFPEIEITGGHWSLSEHLGQMATQVWICSDNIYYMMYI